MLSSLATKCQHFKLRGLQFHLLKWLKIGHFNFKELAFCSQWRYKIPNSNHKVFISLKSIIEMLVGVASHPHSLPLEYGHFTVETGKTAYTFATQCNLWLRLKKTSSVLVYFFGRKVNNFPCSLMPWFHYTNNFNKVWARRLRGQTGRATKINSLNFFRTK